MKDGIIRPDHVTGKLYGSQEASDYQQKIADSVYDYFNEILDEREVERRDDLLSHFLDAEVEGDRLTREDILDICFLFLIAGLDTVTATLDCMFAFLAQHPEQRRQLVEQPDAHPERHRGAPALGDPGHGHRPCRRRGHRAGAAARSTPGTRSWS